MRKKIKYTVMANPPINKRTGKPVEGCFNRISPKVEMAKIIYLDKRSRFHKRRLKNLLDSGYEKASESSITLTLKLKNGKN